MRRVAGGLISRDKPPTGSGMSVTPLPVRRRLSPEESREAALDAARALLVEFGPQAVTLKAVAARIGRTHANLLHHFGSAAGLQHALIERMAAFITTTIRDAVFRQRASEHNPREVVDLAFDAFDSGGAGALASWMILSGNEDALDPILKAIHDLVDDLREDHRDELPIEDETLQLVIMALGDALFGAPLTRVLGLPRERARELAYAVLVAGSGKPSL
jgi:AcrR family transcriptional regulator